MAKIEEIKKEMGIGDENVGYIGCEITDLGIMKKIGFSVAQQMPLTRPKRLPTM